MSAPPICAEKHPRHPFWVCTHPAGHLGPHEARGAEGNTHKKVVLAAWPADSITGRKDVNRRLDEHEQAILELAAALRDAGIAPGGLEALPSPSVVEVSASQSADASETLPA